MVRDGAPRRVVCAQGNLAPARRRRRRPRAATTAAAAARTTGRALADAPEQSPALGFAAFIVAVCTSFASVFFEKMLKGVPKAAWLRNIQLATYSTVIACVGLVGQRGVAAALSPSTLLAGFDQLIVWLSVPWQSAGGILVAVTIKYADNILRGFAQGVAIIVGAVGSHYIGFELSPSSSSASAPSSSPSSSTAGRWTCARRSMAGAARPSSRPPTTATATAAEIAAREYVGGGDRRRRRPPNSPSPDRGGRR